VEVNHEGHKDKGVDKRANERPRDERDAIGNGKRRKNVDPPLRYIFHPSVTFAGKCVVSHCVFYYLPSLGLLLLSLSKIYKLLTNEDEKINYVGHVEACYSKYSITIQN
jgi:hypothetical protein